jgi:hypothetical protein
MTTFLSTVLRLSFLLSVSLSLSIGAQTTEPARAHDAALAAIKDAIDAMGGEARLRDIRTLKFEALGHSYWIDQSERPEGPWITNYQKRTELRDLVAGRLRRTRDDHNAVFSSVATIIVSDSAAALASGDKSAPGRPTDVDDATADLALGPERVLFTAREAADVTVGKEEIAQGVRQQLVQFTWKRMRVRLLLNAYTHLPTAIDRIHDDPNGIWGMVTERTWFTFWNLESNGLLYPRQWNIEWNGTPKEQLTITSFTPNPAIETGSFTIAAEVREAFAKVPRRNYRTMKLGEGGAGVQTLAEGVIEIPGPWNTTFVQQPDGVVIIEAPISSEYSVQVLDEAARRFPNTPIKGVISTSDSWPHLSGLREYVARHIPVYASPLNEPIITRLLKADYRAAPDRLAGSPAAPQFHFVSDKTTIGTGPNRLVVYPIHGENGERMLMVHLPERRLLYAADELQKQRTGQYFMPAYLVDLDGAVTRAGIGGAIDTVFGMHLTPTPWAEIQATIREKQPRSPSDTVH